jgi:hypothetical protein
LHPLVRPLVMRPLVMRPLVLCNKVERRGLALDSGEGLLKSFLRFLLGSRLVAGPAQRVCNEARSLHHLGPLPVGAALQDAGPLGAVGSQQEEPNLFGGFRIQDRVSQISDSELINGR